MIDRGGVVKGVGMRGGGWGLWGRRKKKVGRRMRF